MTGPPPRDALPPPPDTSPRGARALTVVGLLAGVGALWIPPLGVVGMGAGAIGHVKGDRLAMPVAVLAGITTIVGWSLVFLIR